MLFTDYLRYSDI